MTTTPDTLPVVEIIADTLMALHRREPIEPTTAYRQARRIEKALVGADKLKGDLMTTTPNPTAERYIAERLAHYEPGYPVEGRMLTARSLLADMRAVGLLVGDPTEEQIERAARAIYEAERDRHPQGEFWMTWDDLVGCDDHRSFLDTARRVLAAGVAPQEPSEAIHEPSFNRVYCVRCGAKWPCQPAPSPDREKLIAELREEARIVREMTERDPDGPGFICRWDPDEELLDRAADALAVQPALDPEKVAEVIGKAEAEWQRATGPETRIDRIARALCEAAKRGELT